jgi:D-glycerate 3-kinase
MVSKMNGAEKTFMNQHRLSENYLTAAHSTYANLLNRICSEKINKKLLVIGINGCQGSGKSTLAEYLVMQLENVAGISALALSLDDFYCTAAERQALAQSIHPLLATRGVPGTHDLTLALDTLNSLQAQRPTIIPRFNKATDDRANVDINIDLSQKVDVVILEGWCLGLKPQAEADLQLAINPLEASEDAQCVWRRYVNQSLNRYQPLFAKVDISVMLKAPNFDCVYQWRLEQEQKLKVSSSGNKIMSAEKVSRFLQFFQRLTQHALATYPSQVDYLYCLNNQRKVEQVLEQ